MSGSSDAGRVLAGRYRLLGELGRGGMGVVWRARDEVLARDVAVKEVRAPAGLQEHEVRQLYARLEREGRAAARVAHRNVVTVHDVATEDGRPWIVMELVPGLSLAQTLEAEGPMDPVRAAHIGVEVLAALRSAHTVGVLHRDVKPGNVLLGNDGRVVLTDFGIAAIEGSSALTATGQLVGSPEYLAPERALGRAPGPESDLWSLGVMLYMAVEGYSPFRQDTPLSTMRAVVDDALPPPRRAGSLAPVLEGLLRKDPAERMGAAEAERLLRTVAAGRAPRPAAGAAGAHAPTVAVARSDGPAPSTPPAAPGSPGAGSPEPGRRRSRRLWAGVAAAVVAAAIAAGVLVWTLDGGSGGGASTGGATDDGGKNAVAPSSAGGSASSSTSPSSSYSSASPSFSVTIELTALRNRYAGPCPPPEDSAPAFTASLAVDRTPADVVYRWITGSGAVTDGGWQTVRFTGSSRTALLRHTEVNHRAGTPDDDWIALEVKAPRQQTSRHVLFTVTCRTSPTGRTSPSSSASPGSASPSVPTPTAPSTYGGSDR